MLSYVRGNFGNAGSAVTPADVQRVRGMLADANAGEAAGRTKTIRATADGTHATRDRCAGLVLGALFGSGRRKVRDIACEPARARSTQGEVFVPAGRYQPFFKSGANRAQCRSRRCASSAAPVRNAQYLDFVRDHPEWRKSRSRNYSPRIATLRTGGRPDTAGGCARRARDLRLVVRCRALICESRGSRLPKVAEWERFAGAPAGPAARATRAGDGSFAFAMGQRAARSRAHAAGVVRASGSGPRTSIPPSSRGASAMRKEGTPSLFCGDGFRAVDPTNYAAFLRYSFRSSLRGDFALHNLGFRCTRDAS